MANILWPVLLLVILMTGINLTASLAIDNVDDGDSFNDSHPVAKETKNESRTTTIYKYGTPKNNSRDTIGKSTSNKGKTTYTSLAKSPTMKEEMLTTILADMSISDIRELTLTTNVEEDVPTNIIEEDIPVNAGKENMLVNKTKNAINTAPNIAEEPVSKSTNEEVEPTIITIMPMLTGTTKEDELTDSSISEEYMVFSRMGMPTRDDNVKRETPTSDDTKDPLSCPIQEPKSSAPVQKITDECKPSSRKAEEVNTNANCGKTQTCKEEQDTVMPYTDDGLGHRCTNRCCPKISQEVQEAAEMILKSLQPRLEKLEEDTKSIFIRLFALDCSDIRHLNHDSGYQTFNLDQGGKRPVSVLCDMETEGGGWTVVQRRDPELTPVGFERDWHDYRVGFGNPETEYWIGLQNLHSWTNSRQYELRIEITDYDGEAAYAHYKRFYVEGEDQGYRLHVSGYRGTAGDALTNKNTLDSYTADGMMFTTYDRDNDKSKDANCAELWRSGGWWYNCCSWSNLNGQHWRNADGSGVGINWHTWRNKEYLRTSTIMIRPSTYQ